MEGSGGNSGVVTVTNYAQLQTQGQSAHGLFAQSVGGGGLGYNAGGDWTQGKIYWPGCALTMGWLSAKKQKRVEGCDLF
jgi:hypothetical protein